MSKRREHPILFSGPMVRAIIDGTKTQTRRVVKGVPDNAVLPRYYNAESAPRPALANTFGWFIPDECDAWPMNDEDRLRCPYGQPGDGLWVRETWRVHGSLDSECPSNLSDRLIVDYRAGGSAGISSPGKWRPSIHMPRKFCRLLLEVRNVRVERLQDITEADCEAEGCERSRLLPKDCNPFRKKLHGYLPPLQDGTRRGAFACLWNLLNEKRGHGWESNPWVWVIEFEKVSP